MCVMCPCFYLLMYTVSQKNQSTTINITQLTNSLHLLIIFGRERPYLILNIHVIKSF